MKRKIFSVLLTLVMLLTLSLVTAAPVRAVTAPALVARWDFNEGSGTVAHDMTTNVNDGTLKGTFGNALSLDGVNDYVQVGNVGATGEWTIEFWANLQDSSAVIYYPIGLSTSTSNPYAEGIFIAFDSHDDRWGIYDGNSGSFAVEGSTISTNTWHHYAVTKSGPGSTYTLYLDGVLDSQVYNPLLNIVIDNLIIGKRGDAYPFYFPGIIDEVKVSNTASTSFDVGSPPIVDANTLGLWHFDEVTGSTAADATGAHNGLLMNDPNWVASTIPAAGPQWVSGQTGFGDALSFDGDDYIEMSASSSLDVSNPYTIEAWVNISSSVQTPPYKYVGIFRRGSLGAASQIEIYTQPYGAGYGGKFTVVHNRNGAFTYRYFPALPLDQWVHVGVVRNGTSWAVYYDTVPQSEISGPGNTSPAVSLLGSFIGIGYAGSNQYTPGYMRGTVDEVRVWGSALDASQLDDMTPPTITTNVTDGSFYPKPTTGFNLIFGATDAGTGVKSVTATLNGSPVVSGNNLASGEYTLIINAEDAALNKSQTTVHFYVLGNWVTGGGTIKSRGRPTWVLAGNVGIVDGVGIVGNIQIQNNADGEQYHLNDISSLAFSGGSATSPSASNNTVDFVGTDDGGTPVRVIIQDLGEKGARVDKLAIDIGNDGSFELLETVISTGNYQIHGGVSPIVYQLIDCPLNYPSAPFPPGTGFVAFTSPSSGTLRVTLDLFGVQATTAYDVWLGVDSWVGTGGKLGTPTTDSSGNYSGYFDFTVSTGLHRLNIDIVLKDSGSDIYELPGIHGSPTTWVQFTVQ